MHPGMVYWQYEKVYRKGCRTAQRKDGGIVAVYLHPDVLYWYHEILDQEGASARIALRGLSFCPEGGKAGYAIQTKASLLLSRLSEADGRAVLRGASEDHYGALQ